MCHITAISSLAGNSVQQEAEKQAEVPVAEACTLIPYKVFRIFLGFLLQNRFSFVL